MHHGIYMVVRELGYIPSNLPFIRPCPPFNGPSSQTLLCYKL